MLILSNDVFNARSGTVIAVAVTSQEPRAGYPLTWEVAGTGLPKRSWVKISQIRTLSIQRLAAKIADALPEEMASIVEGLNEIIAP